MTYMIPCIWDKMQTVQIRTNKRNGFSKFSIFLNLQNVADEINNGFVFNIAKKPANLFKVNCFSGCMQLHHKIASYHITRFISGST